MKLFKAKVIQVTAEKLMAKVLVQAQNVTKRFAIPVSVIHAQKQWSFLNLLRQLLHMIILCFIMLRVMELYRLTVLSVGRAIMMQV